LNGGELKTRLRELSAKHGIPGAGVAIWHDGRLTEVSTGLTNIKTGVEVDKDTLFLIGSITKTMTTSLIMQLVEQGVLELDQPVITYLPDLRLGSEEATQTVTVRHLVTHTSGIPGDYLGDFGRGDDAVARYVATYGEIGHLHEPGAMISYSNSAFGVAGHLIARVTGETWNNVLRTRLLEPLDMDHTATLAEDALRYRVAVGHRPASNGSLEVGEMWPEFRAGGPAGFTPWAAPRDLIAFARMHMGGGKSPDGQQLLAPESVAAMQTIQKSPFASGSWDGVGIGLGFFVFDYSGHKVIGHNGGRSATLRAIPEQDFAISVLTNTHGGDTMATDFIGDVVGELFGATIPSGPAETKAVSIDSARFAGTYEHVDSRLRIEPAGAGLKIVAEALWSVEPGHETPLQPVDETTFLSQAGGESSKSSFLEPDASGRFGFFHSALRAFKRVD
jgi:CubicO group peptidase (beta-lactamase class C family)